MHVEPTVAPTSHPQWRDGSIGRFWRAAVTFAAIMALALVLGYGMRRPAKSVAQSSTPIPAPKVAAAAASTDLHPLGTVAPEKGAAKDPATIPPQVSALASPPPATPSESNAAPALKPIPTVAAIATAATTARAATTTPHPPTSRSHRDDLIARDTVTYLDKRFQPAPKTSAAKRVAPRKPASRKNGSGVIAANTVTYLNGKPTPKSSKSHPVSQ
jgi:hypothetical protein